MGKNFQRKLFLSVAAISLSGTILILAACRGGETNKFISLNHEDKFYKLNYEGDYHFLDMLKFKSGVSPNDSNAMALGVTSDSAMRTFLSRSFYDDKQLPLPEWSPKAACTAFNSFNPDTQSWNYSRNFDYWYNLDELDPDFLAGEADEFATNPDFNVNARAASAVVYTKPKSALEIKYFKTNIAKHEPVESFSNVYLPYIFGDYSDPTKDSKYWKIAPYFAFDGMNKNGVAIAINVSGNLAQTNQANVEDYDSFNYDRVNLNSFGFVRLILDYAQSVEDAVELAQNFYLHDSLFEVNEPIHFQITDNSGDSVIIEFKEEYGFPSIVVRPEYVAKGTANTTIAQTPYVKDYLNDTLGIVIPGDLTNDYAVTGKDKFFQINENFNHYDLRGDEGLYYKDQADYIGAWSTLNTEIIGTTGLVYSDTTEGFLSKGIDDYDLRWSESWGRYMICREALEHVGGVTNDPMGILAAARMYTWNSWSVVFDLGNFSAKLVYMQQYTKPAYNI